MRPDELLAPGFLDPHTHLKMEAIAREVFDHRAGDTTTLRIRRYDAALGELDLPQTQEAVRRAAAAHASAGTTTCWTRSYYDGMADDLEGRSPRLLVGRNLRAGPDLPVRLEEATELARRPYRAERSALPAWVLHEAGLPRDVLRTVALQARSHPDGPVPVQAHVSQRVEERSELGQGAVELLEETGLLGLGSFVAVHATYCNDADIETLVRRRVPVTYCPMAARRAGVTNPCRRLRGRTPLLLGTDTPPFHMGQQIQAAVADAGFSEVEAFEAATAAPAAALRLPTGSIAAGRLADLVIWSVGRDAGTLDAATAVGRLARQDTARATFVGGRPVHLASDVKGRLPAP